MNTAFLTGNTFGIKVKQTKNLKEYVTFSLATNKPEKQLDGTYEDKATWHNCKAYGANAQYLKNFLKQNGKIGIRGQITNWKVGEVTVTEIIAQEVEIYDFKVKED